MAIFGHIRVPINIPIDIITAIFDHISIPINIITASDGQCDATILGITLLFLAQRVCVLVILVF